MITTEYDISCPSLFCQTDAFTIAVASDLHEHPAAEVLVVLRAARPDLIAVPGDLFENNEPGEDLDRFDDSLISRLICTGIHGISKLTGLKRRKKHGVKKENSYEFLREAGKIAPVFYSLGNHELYLTKEDQAVLKETNTALLNNSSCEVRPAGCGSGIMIGGIPSKQCSGKLDLDFLREFGAYPGFRILLCHHPEYFREVGGFADLILSGHCHGGQIRIGNQGLFAPGQGLFPRFHHGLYAGGPGEGRLLVSSGCSNTASIPRWGNPEEVVILHLHSDKQDEQ